MNRELMALAHVVAHCPMVAARDGTDNQGWRLDVELLRETVKLQSHVQLKRTCKLPGITDRGRASPKK